MHKHRGESIFEDVSLRDTAAYKEDLTKKMLVTLLFSPRSGIVRLAKLEKHGEINVKWEILNYDSGL